MIRLISLVNWAATILLSLLCLAIGTPQQFVSCFFGGSLVGLNLVVIVWSLQKIFQKKSVALAVTVIVIKYAGLLGLFIYLYLAGWKIDYGFVVGLSALFPTLGILAYQNFKKSETDGSF